jgi:hypothetical protein
MDAPRPSSNDYWDLVSPLSISSLYLNKNQAYRGHCMLILDRHAARLDQLSVGEWASYSADLFAAQNAIMRVARPDHINIETLGNVVRICTGISSLVIRRIVAGARRSGRLRCQTCRMSVCPTRNGMR